MELTVAEWVADERLRMQRFEAFWVLGNSDNADDFPERMQPAEWDEQFRSFET